jgi:hypothetical protein
MNVNYANGTISIIVSITYVSIFLLRSTFSCCFPIAVTFVLLNQIRCVRMCHKGEKVSYNFGIEGFMSFVGVFCTGK